MRRATKLRLLICSARLKVARAEARKAMDFPFHSYEELHDALGAIDGILRDVESTLERLSKEG